jgi:ribosome-associated translation inhibitor RaiA
MKIIEKENIPSLNFISYTDINESRKLVIERKLKRAEKLGNAHKVKTKILFKTKEGLFKVETTVWAKTKNYIVLKGGVSIPINCIDSVNFY